MKQTSEMRAKNREFWAKVKELGGWKDGDMIRFPSVYNKEQFEKWCQEQQ